MQPSNLTTTCTTVTFPERQLSATPSYPFYYAPRPRLLPFLDDAHLCLLAPILAYWLSATMFHILDVISPKFLEAYRIHDSEEAKLRNRVSLGTILRSVVLQQTLQTILGLATLKKLDDNKLHSLSHHLKSLEQLGEPIRFALFYVTRFLPFVQRVNVDAVAWWTYWYAWPAMQLFFALLLFDAVQFWTHYLSHAIPFLYKNFHSLHHKLYVSYAYGGLYNHPFEAVFFDALGCLLSCGLPGLSTRQATLLFCWTTLKCVDDHCGYDFPWDPFQRLCGNNARFHDIHHQTYGIKYNFSQSSPFSHWDRLLGTTWTGTARNRRNTAGSPSSGAVTKTD